MGWVCPLPSAVAFVLQIGFSSALAQTQQESRTTQHDYGKDEGDRANVSLAREMDLRQKSRDRVLLTSLDAALKRISEGTFANA